MELEQFFWGVELGFVVSVLMAKLGSLEIT